MFFVNDVYVSADRFSGKRVDVAAGVGLFARVGLLNNKDPPFPFRNIPVEATVVHMVRDVCQRFPNDVHAAILPLSGNHIEQLLPLANPAPSQKIGAVPGAGNIYMVLGQVDLQVLRVLFRNQPIGPAAWVVPVIKDPDLHIIFFGLVNQNSHIPPPAVG